MASCIFFFHRLSVAGHPERPAAALDVVRYFDLWSWDRTLDLIHHELYVKCREAIHGKPVPLPP